MREIKDFRSWLNRPRTELRGLLADTISELSAMIQEIALAEADQIRFRAKAFERSHETSANRRNQEAEVATSTLASTLVELYADKATLIEEKFFLIRLLDA